MESEGQQNPSNPSTLIAALLSKRAKHHEDLRNIEKQTEEHAAMGTVSAMGPGKPKKGRPGPRDVRRVRQYSEPDFDYEDDPDLI